MSHRSPHTSTHTSPHTSTQAIPLDGTRAYRYTVQAIPLHGTYVVLVELLHKACRALHSPNNGSCTGKAGIPG